MAQGRGNACSAPALLLFLLGLHQASAVTYTVGGSRGWDVNVDYTSWAAGLTFKVGDILFFPYIQSAHNVVVVNKAGYDACSETNASATFSEGNTNVTLSSTGAHYYLCSLPGHCSAGMKLAVTVAATAAPPNAPPPASAPAPVKTPSSAAPAPSKTPASSPAPAKTPSSAAPAPSKTPASSPAPGSAPASTIAPASSPTLGTRASSPSAPGSSPSTAGTPPPSPSPPNSATSLFASAVLCPLLLVLAASSFFVGF